MRFLTSEEPLQSERQRVSGLRRGLGVGFGFRRQGAFPQKRIGGSNRV